MDLKYPPEADAFREKVRAFLTENLPAGWKGIGALSHDEADAFRIDAHPDRHDVAAAQREHAVHSAGLEETGDHRRRAVFGNLWCIHRSLPPVPEKAGSGGGVSD